MPAQNGSTLAQPTDARAVRARAISGLYPPLSKVVYAAEVMQRAALSGDRGRLAGAASAYEQAVGEWLEGRA